MTSEENGAIIYSRARVGRDIEVKGSFEVVSTSNGDFQGGLVIGRPEYQTSGWYAFRVKRNREDGDAASVSIHWSKNQILSPAPVNPGTNTFDFRLENGRITATVNGTEVFNDVSAPRNEALPYELLVGVGGFNNMNETVIRYRDLQVKRLR